MFYSFVFVHTSRFLFLRQWLATFSLDCLSFDCLANLTLRLLGVDKFTLFKGITVVIAEAVNLTFLHAPLEGYDPSRPTLEESAPNHR